MNGRGKEEKEEGREEDAGARLSRPRAHHQRAASAPFAAKAAGVDRRWLARAQASLEEPQQSPHHRRRSSRMQRFMPGEGAAKGPQSRIGVLGTAGGEKVRAGSAAPYVPPPQPLRTTDHMLSFREEGTIADIPPGVALGSRLIVAVAAAVMTVHLLLEVLVQAGVVPRAEPTGRVNFGVLTLLNVILGWQSRNGIRKRERDVTLDVASGVIFVSLGMLASDCYYIACQDGGAARASAAACRAPVLAGNAFVALTMLYMLLHLRLLPMLRSRPAPVSPSLYPRMSMTRRLSEVEQQAVAAALELAGAASLRGAGAAAEPSSGPSSPRGEG